MYVEVLIGKSSIRWKITYTWRISRSYVKLPEGIDAVTKVGHIKGTSNIQKQADLVESFQWG